VVESGHSLVDAVIATIGRDPRIPDPTEIAVSVDGGIATLRGTVETFLQRKAAEEDALKTKGIFDVYDRLKVDPLGLHRRADREIRAAALQTLMSDVEVPSDSIHVEVREGRVTLTGDVDEQRESDAAYEDVARLDGVVDITNEIRVSP
jgi:osmotically-inducible protein OsmY